jgi:hypothetical protein
MNGRRLTEAKHIKGLDTERMAAIRLPRSMFCPVKMNDKWFSSRDWGKEGTLNCFGSGKWLLVPLKRSSVEAFPNF